MSEAGFDLIFIDGKHDASLFHSMRRSYTYIIAEEKIWQELGINPNQAWTTFVGNLYNSSKKSLDAYPLENKLRSNIFLNEWASTSIGNAFCVSLKQDEEGLHSGFVINGVGKVFEPFDHRQFGDAHALNESVLNALIDSLRLHLLHEPATKLCYTPALSEQNLNVSVTVLANLAASRTGRTIEAQAIDEYAARDLVSWSALCPSEIEMLFSGAGNLPQNLKTLNAFLPDSDEQRALAKQFCLQSCRKLGVVVLMRAGPNQGSGLPFCPNIHIFSPQEERSFEQMFDDRLNTASFAYGTSDLIYEAQKSNGPSATILSDFILARYPGCVPFEIVQAYRVPNEAEDYIFQRLDSSTHSVTHTLYVRQKKDGEYETHEIDASILSLGDCKSVPITNLTHQLRAVFCEAYEYAEESTQNTSDFLLRSLEDEIGLKPNIVESPVLFSVEGQKLLTEYHTPMGVSSPIAEQTNSDALEIN